MEQNVLNLVMGTYGVDRVVCKVTIDARTISTHQFLQRLFGGKAQTRGYVDIGEHWVKATFHDWSGDLWLEFNPSDWAYQEGRMRICPFDLVPAVAQIVIVKVLRKGDPQARTTFQINEFTGEVFEDFPDNWADQVNLSEVDFARDFGTSGTNFDIEDMSFLRPAYSRKIVTYRNPVTNALETLTQPYSKNTYVHKFYNKFAKETSGQYKNPKGFLPGTFRFEVTIPRPKLKIHKLTTLSQLTEEKCLPILLDLWEKSRYGENLVSRHAGITAIKTQYPDLYGDQLIGFAITQNLGLGITSYTAREIKGFKRDLNKVGIRTNLPLLGQGQSYGHLDFHAGSVVY